MQRDPRVLRQLNAVLDLRDMQREQAERTHERCREALGDARRRLDDDLSVYHEVLHRLGEQSRAGALLDPSQHEQRLLGQQAAQAHLESRRQAVAEAHDHQQQALAALLACKVRQDVAAKACEKLGDAVRLDALRQEMIDVFDSGLARENAHGL